MTSKDEICNDTKCELTRQGVRHYSHECREFQEKYHVKQKEKNEKIGIIIGLSTMAGVFIYVMFAYIL